MPKATASIFFKDCKIWWETANMALQKWWKTAFEPKTFGGEYKMPYYCIKIKGYGKGYYSF